MIKIVLATGNDDKVKEVRRILSDTDCTVVSMKEMGLDLNIIEDGITFEENALIKARAVHKETGAVVWADDSGLCVDAMDQEPGIYSARFMGEDTSYSIKNAYIIDKLKDIHGEKRSARFVCAIACVMENGEEYTVRGTIEGRIAYEPAGENGFGYDPIFYLPEYGKTTAQLVPEEKDSISHRGRALREMAEQFRARLQSEITI